MLELKNISKSYGQGTLKNNVLREINFKVVEGEFVSIMGPSGSGKSTFINILGLIDSEFEGEYILDGKSIEKLNENQQASYRNRDIGFVFQQFHLIDEYTVKENILLSFLYSDQQPDIEYIDSLLQDLGLIDKLSMYSISGC